MRLGKKETNRNLTCFTLITVFHRSRIDMKKERDRVTECYDFW